MISRELAIVATTLSAVVFCATAARAAEPPISVATDQRMLVVRLPHGTLMDSFTRTVDGIQGVVARYSQDNGLTWGEPETLLQLPTDAGAWSLGEALVDQDGEVHLFFVNDAGSGIETRGEGERVLVNELIDKRLDIWVAKSVNGRTEWRGPKWVWKGYTGALNSVIQMTNGRILLPFSYWTSRSWRKRGGGLGEFTFMGQFDSTLIYSDDAGATWELGDSLKIPVPDIVSAYGAVEPVVIQLKDGRVWNLIRAQTGRFWESFSEDGATWSQPRPTNIISSDSPAGLVRLDDGRIVLFWNCCLRHPYAYGGRQVLHAAISDDEGQTWHGYREVARDPKRNEPPPPTGDHGTAYPFPTTVNDAKVIYCTGQGAGRVLLMVLDPEWLLETSQKADFVNGQDGWSVFGTKGVEFIEHPDKADAKALSIRKTASDWPAGAVWNFPNGLEGRLRLRLMLSRRFKGALVALTDHFSTPFDEEDKFHNIFNLWIPADGLLFEGAGLKPSQWHDVVLEWSCAKRECRVSLDGRQVGVLPLLRETTGANYLRLRATVEGTDKAGFTVESVEVDVNNP